MRFFSFLFNIQNLKTRKIRINLSRGFILFFSLGLLVLGFQNCGMSTQCQGGESNNDCSTAVSNRSSSRGPASTASGENTAEGMPQNGSSSFLGGAGGTTTGTIGVGTNGNAGTGAGAGQTQIGGAAAGATSFRITTQPQPLEILTDQYAITYVAYSGGTYPYKFQWYKDDLPLEKGEGDGLYCNVTETCGVSANRYRQEGRYKVVITDSKGLTLTSKPIAVSIQDPAIGCAGGNYFSHLLSGQELNTHPSYELFKNKRGNFLIHSENKEIHDFVGGDEMFGFILAGNFPVGKHLEQRQIPELCLINIPDIQTVPQIAGYPKDLCLKSKGRNCGYHMSGAVKMECSYNKWKFVSNNCRWLPGVQ